jgi:hypothetical protein
MEGSTSRGRRFVGAMGRESSEEPPWDARGLAHRGHKGVLRGRPAQVLGALDRWRLGLRGSGSAAMARAVTRRLSQVRCKITTRQMSAHRSSREKKEVKLWPGPHPHVMRWGRLPGFGGHGILRSVKGHDRLPMDARSLFVVRLLREPLGVSGVVFRIGCARSDHTTLAQWQRAQAQSRRPRVVKDMHLLWTD